MPDLTRRIHTPEMMDDPSHPHEEFARAYRELRTINRRLGGVRAIRRFLPCLAGGLVLDVAAGSCDAGEALSAGGRWRVVGLDRTATGFAMIQRSIPVVGDAFELPFADNTFECVTASLFFHHLSDEDCAHVLRGMARVARRRIIVNELHRSRVAYYSILLLTRMFSESTMIRNDAPLSVRRAFRPAELIEIADRAGLRGRVHRSFPYRLVLVIDKIDKIDKSDKGDAL